VIVIAYRLMAATLPRGALYESSAPADEGEA
jgi:hypothetical protein